MSEDKLPIRRPVSQDFINAMEYKLDCGRAKNRMEWDAQELSESTWLILLDRLREEACELEQACLSLDSGFIDSFQRNKRLEQVRLEAADIANFAMFIADSVGALK